MKRISMSNDIGMRYLTWLFADPKYCICYLYEIFTYLTVALPRAHSNFISTCGLKQYQNTSEHDSNADYKSIFSPVKAE